MEEYGNGSSKGQLLRDLSKNHSQVAGCDRIDRMYLLCLDRRNPDMLSGCDGSHKCEAKVTVTIVCSQEGLGSDLFPKYSEHPSSSPPPPPISKLALAC